MRIHILGICGTFMGGIARLALARGHEVTGADANVYPPMSTQLEALGIPLVEGYEVCDELRQADVVVIGNALSRGNPSVEFVLNEGLRYTSGPAWLAEHVLNGRNVIAVAGTHGKTTTASMVAWILEAAGLAPGFLIGGVPGNFGVSARLGAGAPFVIEADEYDTAFFDKRSKFVHYRPRIAILNNLEFDHADIFPDLAAIEIQFHHLVRTIPASGMVVARHDDPALARVLAHGCWTPCETFGPEPEATWRSESHSADCSRFTLYRSGTATGEVISSAFGEHNANNAVAAIAAAVHAGAPVAACAQAMACFAAPKRRLETLYADESFTLYDDFAHHPTAIAVTLAALRARIGNARIVAILEPRSNTMRQGVHADQLAAALADADLSLLLEPDDLAWDLVAATANMGSRRQVFSSPAQIVAALPQVLRPGDHIVIMSNGGFGGIHARITALLGQGDAAMNAFDEAAGLIPLFPLHTVLFPDGLLPLQIFEPRYVDMVRTCMRQPCGFGVVGIKAGAEVGVASEVYQYGTLARIIDFSNTSAGLLAIVAHGTRRFKVIGREQRADNLLVGSVEWLPEEEATPVPEGYDDLAGAVREVARRAGQSPWQHTDFDDAVWLSWRLAELLPLATAARVELLSIDGAIERLAMCRTMIEKGRDPNA